MSGSYLLMHGRWDVRFRGEGLCDLGRVLIDCQVGAERFYSWGPGGVRRRGRLSGPGHSGCPGFTSSAGWAPRVRTLELRCWGSESCCHPLPQLQVCSLPLCVSVFFPLKVETRKLILFLGLWQEWANELSWIWKRIGRETASLLTVIESELSGCQLSGRRRTFLC